MKRRLCLGVIVVALVAGTAGAAAKATLDVWDWWDLSNTRYKAWFDWTKQQFEAAHPDIEVNLTTVSWDDFRAKLATAVAAGNPPDVSQLSIIWARELYNKGVLAELDPYIQTDPAYGPKAFVPATQVYNHLNGHTFGIPFVMDSEALAYNTTEFEEAGLDTGPLALANWDQFLSAAKKLTQKDASGKVTRSGYVGWNGTENFTSWLTADGGSFYTAGLNGIALGPRAEETLAWMHEIDQTAGIKGPSDFPGGLAAMSTEGTWSASDILQANPKMTFAMTSFPAGPSSDQRGTTTWSNMMAMFKGAKHPKEAWEYIKFVTGLDAQIFLLEHVARPTSPRLDFYQSAAWRSTTEANPWMQTMPQIALTGGTYAFINNAAVSEKVEPLIADAISGKISPKDAVSQINRLAAPLIAGQ